jgi:tryptophan halogenase
MTRPIQSIAIVGGGTAGWIAAAILARAFPGTGLRVTLMETPDIAAVGVGEATIPPILDLLRFLSINEADFVKNTQATFKLGIRFEGWNGPGHVYWHPFGSFGVPVNRRPFHHVFLKARAAGLAPRVEALSLGAALGEASRFRYPEPGGNAAVSGLKYALHFDAGLVAKYFSAYAQALGVARLERKVVAAPLDERGLVDRLVFDGGGELKADLYIDCSGFRGLLIEQALKAGYEDWSRYLPCDRAVAVATEASAPRPPFTRAVARSAGWRWSIPLQRRTGNGYVYAGSHVSDDAALADLTAETGGRFAGEPRWLRFTTGRRRVFWKGNCIAAGLASGFVEPLESTGIHLAVSAIYNLLDHFPDTAFEPRNIAAYNREIAAEFEHVRDFVVLHYALTQRTDTAFWRDCRHMELPDSLKERCDDYVTSGRIPTRSGELFTDLSWFHVFEGMGLMPQRYDPLMDVLSRDTVRDILGRIAAEVDGAVRTARAHDGFF